MKSRRVYHHHVLEEINGRMKELKQLQKSKEEQARELLVIQATKETEQKQQKKLEKKLNTHQKGMEGQLRNQMNRSVY